MSPKLSEADIERAMLCDQPSLTRQHRALQQAGQSRRKSDRRRFLRRLQESVDRRERRRRSVPRITWPDDLPITAQRQAIAESLQDHQVIVVCGETGSGKSTQLPKIALAAGRGVGGVIGHTQPRRIAARSVAARLADELGCQEGSQVGWRIRFSDRSGPDTLVRFMTDGILLAETQSDPLLLQYDTIIVDEAHERSLNIDFLLGYLKRLLPQRPDLRVIVTSATIDTARFAAFFEDAAGTVPVVEVRGRTWPVEIRWRPLLQSDENGSTEERDWLDGTVEAVQELAREHGGHILVFLPTERAIRETQRRLNGLDWPGDMPGRGTQIVPLFGRLSMADQNRVFQPYSHRRIVLATNVAESSITVPGIRSVVDTGTARISRYSSRSRIQRLPIEPVSQASARQRAGRCGRVGPGVCIRLYSEEDFEGRDAFTPPEISRTGLAGVILRTLSLGLGPLEEFPFPDPPALSAVREGYRTLEELGAIDRRNDACRLTDLGKQMAKLPVDPRISRIILAAVDEQTIPEILIIAAALEIQDPRERPLDRQQEADRAHAAFRHSGSDFLSWLKLWDAWHEQKQKLSGSRLKKWCRQHFLSWMRMREWMDIHRQLRDLLRQSGDRSWRHAAGLDPVKDRRGDEDAVHRSLLTGLLSHIAWRSGEREYTGAGGRTFVIWPGSVLAGKPPKWLVAGELIETNRRYARMAAGIRPEWVEPLAEHLMKRSVSEPHWNAATGTAMAYEKLTLWGLPIVPRRPVPLSRHDPQQARELMIRHGLVGSGLLYAQASGKGEEDAVSSAYDDEQRLLDDGIRSRLTPGRVPPGERASRRPAPWASRLPFLQHNAEVLDELHEMQRKTRRLDVVPSDDVLFTVFDRQVPSDVCDRHELARWYRRERKQTPDVLKLSVDQFVGAADRERSAAEFPSVLEIGTMRLPLSWDMQPGESSDGVTVTVPEDGLGRLSADRIDWLVPGLLEEKVTALIRGLPRSVRRLLVPVPETARGVVGQLSFGQGNLLRELARLLSRAAGEPISVEDLRRVTLPVHLQMNVRVVDGNGRTLAQGRCLRRLREQMAARERAERSDRVGPDPAVSPEAAAWQRRGLTSWDFGDLPERVPVVQAGIRLDAFPAVRDDGTSAALTLCRSAAEAQIVLRGGVRRLVFLSEETVLRKRIRNLGGLSQIELLASSIRGIRLRAHLELLMAERAFLSGRPLPRTRQDFEAALTAGRRALSSVSAEFVGFLPKLFEDYHATRRCLENCSAAGAGPRLRELRQHLAGLVHADFLAVTPWAWLTQFPRYFACLRHCVQRMTSGGLKTEQELAEQVRPWQERLEKRTRSSHRSPMLDHYRWMLEEYRVRLLAPRLGTAIDVSEQKLDDYWQAIP